MNLLYYVAKLINVKDDGYMGLHFYEKVFICIEYFKYKIWVLINDKHIYFNIFISFKEFVSLYNFKSLIAINCNYLSIILQFYDNWLSFHNYYCKSQCNVETRVIVVITRVGNDHALLVVGLPTYIVPTYRGHPK